MSDSNFGNTSSNEFEQSTISNTGKSTTVSLLTNRQCYDIINAVRKRQCLWNIACETYKNRGFIQTAWDQVAKEVNIPRGDVMQKWVLLRQQFRNAYSKQRNSKVPGGTPRNIFYKSMLFMAPVFRVPNMNKTPRNVKRMPIQLKNDELIAYMEKHLELARTHQFPLNSVGQIKLQQGWNDLAATLNAKNGCSISAEKWRTCWNDLRERVRAKVISKVNSDDDLDPEHVERIMAMISDEILPVMEIKTEGSIEFDLLDHSTTTEPFEDENDACIPPPPPPTTHIEKICIGNEAPMSAFESQYIQLMKEQIEFQRRRDERETERHDLWMKLRKIEYQNSVKRTLP